MARKQLGFLSIGLVCLGLALLPAQAGESGLQKELDQLNQITGDDVSLAARKKLIEDPEHAAALCKFGLSAARKNQLSYNAALALGYAAAKAKDMKTAEVYLRVCLGKAAKLQSLDMLRESGETLAEFYYEYKQYADCARICKELSELKTDGATDRVVIQTIKDRNGRIDFGEPQEGFKLSERLKGDVYDIRIKALAKQGKFDQALKILDKEEVLIEPFTLGLKGWVLHEASKFDESADAYEKAIAELGKDDKFEVGELQFRYEVANVYVDLKKIEQATEHLEYVIKKRPESPVFYNDLGFIWADNGIRLEEAEKLIRKALQLDRERRKKSKSFDAKTDQDSGAYLDSLGWVLFKQKKNEQAKKWLLQAVEDKNARHIEIYDHLGDVYMSLGDRAHAIRAWEDGLKFVNENRRDAERKISVEKKLEKAKAK